KELIPALAAIMEEYGKPEAALFDAGYFSAANIEAVSPKIDLYVSPGRMPHGQSLEERLGPAATGSAPEGATPAQAMSHKLKTEKGRSLYRLRKMTVEPVIGIIKQALGFRQFLLRGREKTQGEWGLV